MTFEIVHELPGRLRLCCGKDAFTLSESRGIAAILEQLDGIEQVRSSFRTGSLLILHRPGFRDMVLEAVRMLDRQFYGNLEETEPSHLPLQRQN